MRLIDCGISGQEKPYPQTPWLDLGLPGNWTSICELLTCKPTARAAQVEALMQAKILDSRKNLVVATPTNSGKSLIGTLILLREMVPGSRVVLVEPFRALAKEKIDELEAVQSKLSKLLGFKFTIRLTTGDYRLTDEELSEPPGEDGQFIVATPERLDVILKNPENAHWVDSITAVCVDEAHLISEPNRGPTLECLITSFAQKPKPPRICLLSASLGNSERLVSWLTPCDLVSITGRVPPLQKSIARLTDSEKADEAIGELAKVILSDESNSMVIFVYQTASTNTLAKYLNSHFPELVGKAGVVAYHSQMPASQRAEARKKIESGESRCVVTTTALSAGVNLPATHVIVRDVSFPGEGPQPITDLLQMAGRAGRGDRSGTAILICRENDSWNCDELENQLRNEPLPEARSAFDSLTLGSKKKTNQEVGLLTARVIAFQLARNTEMGLDESELVSFFEYSLGGTSLTTKVPQGVQWLCDPSRLLAHKDDQGKISLTQLGLRSVQAGIPLDFSAGLGQLVRDILQFDPSDAILDQMTNLDLLILVEALNNRSRLGMRFTKTLPDKIITWMESKPENKSGVYRKFIHGTVETSKASELMGSLGFLESGEQAFKAMHLATLRAITLIERSRGLGVEEIERRWNLSNLAGVEENWKDTILWLLSGLRKILEVKCFYFCLRETCEADKDRIDKVKMIFRKLAINTFEIQENLKYCSPLGSMRLTLKRLGKKGVGDKTIEKLESNGINSISSLCKSDLATLLKMGIRKDAAQVINNYVQMRMA